MRKVPDDLVMHRQDWINLIIIFVPILTILLLLLGNKDAVGAGRMGCILYPWRRDRAAGRRARGD